MDKLDDTYKPVLITDIGGTNSRMRIINVSWDPDKHPIEVDYKKLKSKDYKSLLHVCQEYLKPFVGTSNYPILAVIALPGPIVNNQCEITANLTFWGLSDGKVISEKLNIRDAFLLNDFQVIGYGVMSSHLVLNKDLFVVNEGKKNTSSPIAIVGPGTGLGHGIAVKSKYDKYHEVCSSEGGHQLFLAHTQREWDFRCYLADKFQIEHVSLERGLAGPGIPYMFNYLIDKEQMVCKVLDPTDKEFDKKRWEITAEEIIETAMKETCPVCTEVRKMFVDILGNSLSNFSVCTVPLYGLYIVGGICTSLKDFILNDKCLMTRFLDKGRMKDFLKNIPIYLVTHHQIGLLGSEEFARRIIEKREHQ